jgi:ABC-2 type transport system permease protein
MSPRPNYWNVFCTFAHNSLVRDLTFRSNFLIETVSSMAWMLMNLGFYDLIFRYSPMLGAGTDWGKYQFFVFIGTTMIINSIVQAFFMPNAEEFSELIRTGNLDFALLKPIDTQFLISLQRVNWSALSNIFIAILLMVYSLWQLQLMPSPVQILLFLPYVMFGVAILYSLMISLAATSIWLGRNQSLYDFWFYITNFSRYPMEIYKGDFGTPLRLTFTYVIPVLVVVNVPARLMAMPLQAQNWWLLAFGFLATLIALLGSRWVFVKALESYRSASS